MHALRNFFLDKKIQVEFVVLGEEFGIFGSWVIIN
jgi:hypothetical protein